MGTKVLRLHLKREYWQQIKDGSKLHEFRLYNGYWMSRLCNASYSHVEYILGYPKADDQYKRFTRPYFGYQLQTIQHKHFGESPVEVFAIYTQCPTHF